MPKKSVLKRAQRDQRSPLIRLTLTILASSSLAGFPAPLMGQEAAALSELPDYVEAYQRTWNSRNTSALGVFFAEDADLVMYNQPRVQGRRAIEDMWRSYFEVQEAERRGTFDVTSMKMLAPGVAVLDVASTTAGLRGGRDLVTRRARGTWLLKKDTGNWQIWAMRGFPVEPDSVELNASREAVDALRPQVRAFVARYEQLFNRHDAEGLSALYLDDADMVVREQAAVRGVQAIRDWWRTYFSQPRPYRALIIIEQIRMITDDVALLNIVGTDAGSDLSEPQESVRVARTTWILSRENGHWLIATLRVLPSEADRVIRASSR
jgi:uncharacterized protein (TIGR02246 family)